MPLFLCYTLNEYDDNDNLFCNCNKLMLLFTKKTFPHFFKTFKLYVHILTITYTHIKHIANEIFMINI